MEQSKQLATKIFREIHGLPYYKNYAACSGAVHNIASHENAVEDVLQNNGLIKWTPSHNVNSESVWNWINYSAANITNERGVPFECAMLNNSYMAQPCGTHDSPDFIIKINNTIIPIECKSADGHSPMYNSGGIKQNLIYAFCSNKNNSTTIYCGKDVCTIEQQSIIDELIQKQKLLEIEYNERLRAVDVNNRGISYYTRPMIQQSGGAKFTNYFTHAQREQCEQNVYTYIDTIIEKNYMI
jgi:hypothetical protein